MWKLYISVNEYNYFQTNNFILFNSVSGISFGLLNPAQATILKQKCEKVQFYNPKLIINLCWDFVEAGEEINQKLKY